MSFLSHDPHPWPERTWRRTEDGLLRPRSTVLVAGEDDLPVAVLRRCVRCDDVIVAGPLVTLEDVLPEARELRPDLVLLCGTTDDPRLHAAMHALYAGGGPSRVALLVRLGSLVRCLPMGDFDPALDRLLLHLAGETAEGRAAR
ncbi:hypothetical protein GKE82_19595 [Conexibacter sp. W3-3-2]|uniref:Uncharacterized protein n=1 Tax=Paraconexibacter algicola TaxID=2133960 RepID=A0A2T4ULH5_9ACTN|nr:MULTISPECIES: hypothetical protein [Solirubrobacterales]MTD46429.1 hypothetical protein [Conexibacter sp. W3-3-2]PTL60081.1 hypothetical protein C7Y72_10710 [Paraconexibacter algicola]